MADKTENSPNKVKKSVAKEQGTDITQDEFEDIVQSSANSSTHLPDLIIGKLANAASVDVDEAIKIHKELCHEVDHSPLPTSVEKHTIEWPWHKRP
jgi:hypothetical protein